MATIQMPSTKQVQQRTTLLPEGKYKVYVDDVSMQTGPNSTYLKWILKTQDEPKETNNRTLYNNTFLSEKGFWTTLKFLDSLGYEYPVGVSDWALDPEDVLDKECIIEIEHEIYNGSPVPRVKAHYAVPQTDVLSDDDLYTVDEINAMDKSELEDVIKAHRLKIDGKSIDLDELEELQAQRDLIANLLKEDKLLA